MLIIFTVLAALLSALQLTPMQHANLTNLVGHLQATPLASPSRCYPENPVLQRLMNSPTASGFHSQPNHAALNSILAPFLPVGMVSGYTSPLFAMPIPPPPTPAAPVATVPVAPIALAAPAPVAVTPAASTSAMPAPVQPPAGTPGGAGPGNLPAQAIVVPIGYGYEVPSLSESGPYYIVVRGTEISIFTGWYVAPPSLIGLIS